MQSSPRVSCRWATWPSTGASSSVVVTRIGVTEEQADRPVRGEVEPAAASPGESSLTNAAAPAMPTTAAMGRARTATLGMVRGAEWRPMAAM